MTDIAFRPMRTAPKDGRLIMVMVVLDMIDSATGITLHGVEYMFEGHGAHDNGETGRCPSST